jgi:hypothetical protein
LSHIPLSPPRPCAATGVRPASACGLGRLDTLAEQDGGFAGASRRHTLRLVDAHGSAAIESSCFHQRGESGLWRVPWRGLRQPHDSVEKRWLAKAPAPKRSSSHASSIPSVRLPYRHQLRIVALLYTSRASLVDVLSFSDLLYPPAKRKRFARRQCSGSTSLSPWTRRMARLALWGRVGPHAIYQT